MNQHPHYELFEELGRGENTVVYRAYDLSLGREVVIKELDENGRRDQRHCERFLREAQFLAQFEHDNVLRVYSVDTDRGWIIMEMMKGTLASVIEDGPSSPDLVRSVLKQTLEALAFLHEKNKVHCAVRPSNLLINDAGRVKLSEFEHTDAGGEIRVPTGSKKYLAPELIRPDFGDFGPALDLYCLGFVALELIKGPKFESLFPGTGKGAIDADTAWLRWHSSAEELDSTRKLVKSLPDDLAQVLDHMLKKHVADRPQSAQEVLKELADRPFVRIPVAGLTDEEEAKGEPQFSLSPGAVKVLSAPEKPAPVSSSPSPASFTPHNSKPLGSKQSQAPKLSKEWLNQLLSRPYVMYPLCGSILFAALWMSFRLHSGTADPVESSVAVTFDVEPDLKDVKVVVGGAPLLPREDGTFEFNPGNHSVTWSKEGYHPVTRKLDISIENTTFQVILEPVVKYSEVVVEVNPEEAELQVDGKSKKLLKGVYTHKLEEGKPLQVTASLDGYVSRSQSFSSQELSQLDNRIKLELEREKPQLPKSLIAKPGATLDPDVQLPTRVLSATLVGGETMEFALVNPGEYRFGYSSGKRTADELPERKVQVEAPFYIAVHETTNAQYEKFLASSGVELAGSRWMKASEKWAAGEYDRLKNSLPVTNVSPEQAQAFCEWMGGRLPTEIEWESAVRGPQDRGFPFPWGNAQPSRERCQVFRGELRPYPVDQLPDGGNSLGLMNTLGNAAEWCRNSEEPGDYILRGCSFATANIHHVRITWRGKGDSKGEEDTGFRVVVPLSITQQIPSQFAAGERASTNGTIPATFRVISDLPWKIVSRTMGREP